MRIAYQGPPIGNRRCIRQRLAIDRRAGQVMLQKILCHQNTGFVARIFFSVIDSMDE